jgi:hypothetical protein
MFKKALETSSSTFEEHMSTGVHELDGLLDGGLKPGILQLFYGDAESGVDQIIHMAIASAIMQSGMTGRVIYLNCGNYKYGRTLLDLDLLVRMFRRARLDPREALSRIHAVYAFSEDQQEESLRIIEKTLREEEAVRLLVAHNIAGLFTAEWNSRGRSRGDRLARLKGIVQDLAVLCAVRGLPLLASCRPVRGSVRIPHPEGGRYLRHKAAVIVYFERRGSFIHAHLIKHPFLPERSVKFSLESDFMGRVTLPFRTRLKNEIERLARTYRDALKDPGMRMAFDKLVEALGGEVGAMGNADLPSILDAVLLTAAVENRRLIEELRESIMRLETELREKRSRPNGNDER